MAAIAGERRSGWLWRLRLSTDPQRRTTGRLGTLFGNTLSRSSILMVIALVSGWTIVVGLSLIPRTSVWVGIWLPMQLLSYDVVRFGSACPVRPAKRPHSSRSGQSPLAKRPFRRSVHGCVENAQTKMCWGLYAPYLP